MKLKIFTATLVGGQFPPKINNDFCLAFYINTSFMHTCFQKKFFICLFCQVDVSTTAKFSIFKKCAFFGENTLNNLYENFSKLIGNFGKNNFKN